MFSGVDQSVGTLDGRFFQQGHVFGSDTDAYHFHISQAGTIDVQLSRLVGTGRMILRNSSGDSVKSTSLSTHDQRITFNATEASDFTLSIENNRNDFAPAVFYTLALSTDLAPGSTFSNSFDIRTNQRRNLGTLSEVSATNVTDFVGFLDTDHHTAKDLFDTYRFSVPAFGDMDFQLSGISSDAADGGAKVDINMQLFQDLNSDGRLQSSEAIAPPSGGIGGNIETGQYFLVVSALSQPSASGGLFPQAAGGSNYTLKLKYTHADLARNSLNQARNVVPAGGSNFTDLLSANDTTDIYRFDASTGGPFNFDTTLSGMSSGANFNLQLIQDKNDNFQVDAGEVIASSQHSGSANEHITRTLTKPDHYFVKVNRASGESKYDLAMSLFSTDTIGNTLGTAKNLGALSSSPAASEFVGAIDTADVYRVDAAQAGEMRVQFNSPTNGNVAADVIRDANNDGIISNNEILGSLTSGNVLDGVVLPAAGKYFVRVKPNNNATSVNYNMGLSFSTQTPFGATPINISANANNRIEVENFDNGGDPDAVHDTDPADGPSNGVDFRSNEGVDLRNTNDPQGGGLRLATTKSGEYLEYTVKVAQSSAFNFEFRVSSPGDGAAFHLEVDGNDVTGPVAIPNTGGVDNMTTISSPLINVALSKGPHVLRVAFDHQTGGNPDIAGTMNFFNVRPSSLSSGTFQLTPGSTTASVGQSTMLSLDWTVPNGASWHTLKNVELRLLDENGSSPLRIRFNESNNTVQLYNPATHSYGPSRAIGSDNVLSNSFAQIRLATSKIEAVSPSASTVKLTFDITFNQPAANHHLRVQAAAADDAGHSQGFDLAGTLDVLD